jgi:hypothetical protein
MAQSQQQLPFEVSAALIFFYGASAHFWAMAYPISLLQPCLFLAAAAASLSMSNKSGIISGKAA